MLTLDVQKRLKQLGFDPGPIDGIRGALTIAAIRAFQASKDLEADGIVGPLTLAALTGNDAPAEPTFAPQTMPWMIEGFSLLGLKEDTSSSNNPIIIGWGKALKIAYSDDETPWCGLFTAHCIGSQMPLEPRPNGPLGARNWSKFGNATKPQYGAVMVFWRHSKASGKGHVGFYVGEDAKTFHILGGNQSDKVSVTRMPKERFLEARWPKSVPDPKAGPRFVEASGKLAEKLH